MSARPRICVYCGSRTGSDRAVADAAGAFGAVLAKAGFDLVYGGGRVGLMGLVADASLAAGARVFGVIPESLMRREVGHQGLTELHVVPDMHQRKRLMAEMSDAFVALPGGIGTFEELFEVWTWRHLDYHRKPLALLDVAGYYQPLLHFLNSTLDAGFIDKRQMEMLLVDDQPARLVERLRDALPQKGPPDYSRI